MLQARAIRVAPFSSSSPMPTAPAEEPRDATTVLRQRRAGDRRVVATLLLIAVLAVLVLSTVTVRASVRADAVRQRAGGALNRASLAQMEFHTQHRRFALWDELSARGLRLPSPLRVEASTASPSHWYLRLRDDATGITCDRVGMLTDAPGQPVVPTCARPD